jgi:HSP20 family protein
MNALQEQPARPEVVKSERQYIAPEVNIEETNDGYLLEADMPGVNKNGLEVTLEGNELTLVGHRQEAQLKGELIHRESSAADFRRVFELAPEIDNKNIAARIDNGVLTVLLPKAEKVKPRKIAVS